MVGVALVAVLGLVAWSQVNDSGTDTDTAPELTTHLWIDGLTSIGATVFIDGDSAGTVPFWTDSLALGERRVRVVAPGRATASDTILLAQPGALVAIDADRLSETPFADGPEQIAATLPDAPTRPEAPPQAPPETAPSAAQSAPSDPPATTGDLRVTSSPSGAAVALDGRPMGRTPLSLSGVRPGRRSVSVSRQGYETVVRQVTLRPGGQVDAAIALRPRVQSSAPAPSPAPRPTDPRETEAATGIVEILVRPWGRIEIDGVTHQEETDVVYRAALAAGSHQVRVTHPQLGSDVRTVTVRAGGRARVEFDLTVQEP